MYKQDFFDDMQNYNLPGWQLHAELQDVNFSWVMEAIDLPGATPQFLNLAISFCRDNPYTVEKLLNHQNASPFLLNEIIREYGTGGRKENKDYDLNLATRAEARLTEIEGQVKSGRRLL